MQKEISKRPLGITILVILEVIGAIVLLVASLALITTPIGIAVAIGCILRLIVAWGLWTLKRWAFWVAVVLEVIHFFYNLFSLLVGHNMIAIGTLILNLVVLIYLFADRNVRAAFRT
jgi:uncharacterized membrane protein (DUF2068 family)